MSMKIPLMIVTIGTVPLNTKSTVKFIRNLKICTVEKS